MMVKFRETFITPLKQAFVQYREKRKLHPRLGKVDFGDLKRAEPISRNFGFERGKPVDRFYIERFLDENSHLIKGRVLEIGDNAYTLQFGKENVSQSDVLHYNNSNGKATITGDLTNLPQVEDGSFDCIILTQTLQFIYEKESALKTCRRILKPNGALLMTVPGISPLDDFEFGHNYFWNFTKQGVEELMKTVFPYADTKVDHHGNMFTAISFLNGISLNEIDPSLLEKSDKHIQMLISCRSIKK
ncbi:class I SAM-dependent methyltransferase [Litoribacter populi]|uniref:class I SAM-dependent methyltransferase n=1 Tax=Litoribacter populi TaxID=2598460 RepID=UPI00118145D4|nr:class I SAM-dependent methyltransferase [Litoribacter populi]